MFRSHLKKIRKLPHEKRTRVINLYAGAVTLVIVLAWLGFLLFLKPAEPEVKKKPLFGEGFRDFFENINLESQDFFDKKPNVK